jgi:hypothetical protein
MFTSSTGINFDYAFVSYGDLGFVNMFTVGMNF